MRFLMYFYILMGTLVLSACNPFSAALHKDWDKSDDGLSPQKIEQVITQLKDKKISYLISESPGLGDWLLHRLQEADINGQEEDKDKRFNEARLSLALQKMSTWQDPPGLYRDAYVKKGWPSKLQALCTTWVNHAKLANWTLTPVEDELLAQVLLATNLTKEPQPRCMSATELSKTYRHIAHKPVASQQLQAAILQLLWLDIAAQLTPENTHLLPAIAQTLYSSGDVIRLVGNQDKQVAIASVRLIAELVPSNAIHALRFHLIQSADDDLKIEILKAMQHYGVETRTYHAQLRQLLPLTQSVAVRQAITDVLNKTNGH